ncbi:hypothetical protein CBM2598_U10023 [Cupriavidus taiwanensis]|nr:hypothetical protein CBM2598_U10023 [Cupriavidus taiwanensis]
MLDVPVDQFHISGSTEVASSAMLRRYCVLRPEQQLDFSHDNEGCHLSYSRVVWLTFQGGTE